MKQNKFIGVVASSVAMLLLVGVFVMFPAGQGHSASPMSKKFPFADDGYTKRSEDLVLAALNGKHSTHAQSGCMPLHHATFKELKQRSADYVDLQRSDSWFNNYFSNGGAAWVVVYENDFTGNTCKHVNPRNLNIRVKHNSSGKTYKPTNVDAKGSAKFTKLPQGTYTVLLDTQQAVIPSASALRLRVGSNGLFNMTQGVFYETVVLVKGES